MGQPPHQPDYTVYDADAEEGWSASLRVEDPGFNGFVNGFMLPIRGQTGDGGFLTRPDRRERFFYTLEIAQLFRDQVDGKQIGPLMAPVFDDLNIFYMPHPAARVIHESEVVYD